LSPGDYYGQASPSPTSSDSPSGGGSGSSACVDCPNLQFRGDANNDCQIDSADMAFISDVMFNGIREFCTGPGVTSSYYEPADVDDDGIVNAQDISYIADWLYGGGSPPTSIVEETELSCEDFGYENGQVGELCSNGETYNLYGCYTRSRTCTDHDGEDFNTASFVEYGVIDRRGLSCDRIGGGTTEGISSDVCDGNDVIEYTCTEINLRNIIRSPCPGRCVAGACE